MVLGFEKINKHFGYLVIIIFGHLQRPLIDSRDFLNKIGGVLVQN
jgi:hypothetical protein